MPLSSWRKWGISPWSRGADTQSGDGPEDCSYVAISKAVMDMMSRPEDPMTAQQGQMALQRIFDLSPEKVGEIQDHFKDALEKINEESAHFEANPAQVTQEQYGKWDVTYKKNGREYFTRVDTRAAAQGLGDQIVDIRRNDSDGDTRVDYRAKVAGDARESIRWMDNHMSGVKQNAAYWSRALFKAQTKMLLESSEISTRPDLQRMINMHSDNMLMPDPEAGRMMTKLASTWYLGGNFASAVVNGTQMFTRGAAEMTRLTGNPISSFKNVMAAVREVGGVRSDVKLGVLIMSGSWISLSTTRRGRRMMWPGSGRIIFP
jgi:hypothetical protein